MSKVLVGWLFSIAALTQSVSQAAVYEGAAGGFAYRITADAGSPVISADDPSVRPYFGVSWFLTTAQSFEFSVELISGPSVFPEYINGDYIVGGSTRAILMQAPVGSIRFSNPQLTTMTSAVNPVTGDVIAEDALGVGMRGYGPMTPITFRGVVNFMPGNMLIPSDDPTCASFSCMQPITDRIQITAGVSIIYAAVPDIHPWQMMAVALLLAPLALSRRRAAVVTHRGWLIR